MTHDFHGYIKEVKNCQKYSIIKSVKMECPECNRTVIEEYHKNMALINCPHCKNTFTCFPKIEKKKRSSTIVSNLSGASGSTIEISNVNISVPMVYGLKRKKKIFYFSDKKTWEEEKCCNDMMDGQVRSLLYSLEFSEDMEGVWEYTGSCDIEEVINFLNINGFEYNKNFENFMKDVLE